MAAATLPLRDKENVGAVHKSSKILRSPLTPARHGLAFRENVLEKNSIALSAGTHEEEDVVCNVTAEEKFDVTVAVDADQRSQTTELAAQVSSDAERDASTSAPNPPGGSIGWQTAARRSSLMQADMSSNAQTGLQRTAVIQDAASKDHPAGESLIIYVWSWMTSSITDAFRT